MIHVTHCPALRTEQRDRASVLRRSPLILIVNLTWVGGALACGSSSYGGDAAAVPQSQTPEAGSPGASSDAAASGASEAGCLGTSCSDRSDGNGLGDVVTTVTVEAGAGSGDAMTEVASCMFNDQTYPNGSWFPGVLDCDICGCKSGNVGCMTPFCAQSIPTGGPGCTYISPQGSATYASGATWTCNCGATCLCYDGQPFLLCTDGG
jgi:hypothetical protein